MFPPVKRVAVQCLLSIFNENRYSDKVLEYAFKSNRKLGSRDRKQLAEAVYGSVRHWRLLCHLSQVPYGEGAVYTDGHAEAVLSRLPELGAAPADLPFAVRESVSDVMYEVFRSELGEAKAQSVLKSMNVTADVFLRVNTLKGKPSQVISSLRDDGVEARLVEGSDITLQLAQRKNVFQTKAFQAGLFEVQDIGSQKIAPLLAPKAGDRVVDACAGAGGKSLHLAALMGNKGKIIAMDIHQWKLDELKKRAKRAGVSVIETRVIENNKVIKRLYENADCLLLDVPCSGSGVLKRNPDAKWKFTLEELDRLRALQTEILATYSNIARVGGRMVYATCSVFPSENEKQVQNFLTAQEGRFRLDTEVKILPDQMNSDGFYAALLTRVS